MIKIDFNPSEDAVWTDWLQRCDTSTEELTTHVLGGGEVIIDENLYREFKKFYRDGDAPFARKCAYCETIITGSQDGDVEHFRPKKQLRNFKNEIVMDTTQVPAKSHPGYYWLAYKWENLLVACKLCNSLRGHFPDHIGKGNRFPVNGNYAWNPGEEENEHPLLLNPMWDDPTSHLSIDETGVFRPLSEKGEVTEKLLGLNKRNLPEDRAKTYQDVQSYLKTTLSTIALLGHVDPSIIPNLKRIHEIKEGYESFTAIGRQAILDFKNTRHGSVNEFLAVITG